MCRSNAIAHEVSFNSAEPVPKHPAKAESQHHSCFSEGRLKGTASHVGTPYKAFHKWYLPKGTLLDAWLFSIILNLVHVVGKPSITKNKHIATENLAHGKHKGIYFNLEDMWLTDWASPLKKCNHSGFILKTETMNFHSPWQNAQFLLRHTDVLAELELLPLCEGVSMK